MKNPQNSKTQTTNPKQTPHHNFQISNMKHWSLDFGICDFLKRLKSYKNAEFLMERPLSILGQFVRLTCEITATACDLQP
jgi:hypothetical protein